MVESFYKQYGEDESGPARFVAKPKLGGAGGKNKSQNHKEMQNVVLRQNAKLREIEREKDR